MNKFNLKVILISAALFTTINAAADCSVDINAVKAADFDAQTYYDSLPTGQCTPASIMLLINMDICAGDQTCKRNMVKLDYAAHFSMQQQLAQHSQQTPLTQTKSQPQVQSSAPTPLTSQNQSANTNNQPVNNNNQNETQTNSAQNKQTKKAFNWF